MNNTYNPSVIAICATAGRHTCLERSVRMFLEQDYEGSHTLLIFNNAYNHPLVLHIEETLPPNKKVQLINSCDKEYSNLGEIYIDTLPFINTDLVTFWDDDDIFLFNHMSEGVKGYLKASTKSNNIYRAYKPKKSYYRSVEGVQEVENTLEPSIFIDSEIIKSIGFQLTTSDQHIKWVSFLERTNSLFVDPEGTPTLVYNWGDTDIPTWKTSGDPANPNNFNNYRNFSIDHGDGIISPISKKKIELLYNQIKTNDEMGHSESLDSEK